MSTPSVSGYGLTATLPSGWEGRITKRAAVAPAPALGRVVAAARADLVPKPPLVKPATTEITSPVLHLGNFALPPKRGDFGSGAVELMGANNAFIVLLEYSADSLGTALFAPSALPRILYPRMFGPRTLQRILPGQGGYQAFFTEAGRAFTLYVVLGSLAHATKTVPLTNNVLAGLRIEPS